MSEIQVYCCSGAPPTGSLQSANALSQPSPGGCTGKDQTGQRLPSARKDAPCLWSLARRSARTVVVGKEICTECVASGMEEEMLP